MDLKIYRVSTLFAHTQSDRSSCETGLTQRLISFFIYDRGIPLISMAKILITGAAGFIGSHTAEKLLGEGYAVFGVDDFRTGKRSNLDRAIKDGMEFCEFSILDGTRLSRLVRSSHIDAIIHLSALVSVSESISEPDLNFRLNILGTHRVAEAARSHGVKRLVFASSAAVYGDSLSGPIRERSRLCPISPYGSAKLASEHMLLSYAAYGIEVRIQRYFNVFGLRQDPASPYSGVISIFVRNFSQDRPVTIYGDGRQTRDFINVTDVAQANLLAATKSDLKTGIANICTGQSISLLQVVRELKRLCPNAPAPSFVPARSGDIRHSVGAAQQAKRQLGFTANSTLRVGLAQLMRATQSDKHAKGRGNGGREA
jgi:UDP-glucose 4-epimerase